MKKNKEFIVLINSTDNNILSVEEKKQWIKLLPQMTNKDKEELIKILLENKEKTKEFKRQKEGLKRLYKEDLNKIYKYNNTLENILKIIDKNLTIFIKGFYKNPIKYKTLEELRSLNYLSKKEIEEIKEKLEKAKKKKEEKKNNKLLDYLYQIQQGRNIEEIKEKLEKAKNKKEEKKNNKLLDYLYQIQQGRNIEDIEIEINKKLKDSEKNIISAIGNFRKYLDQLDYIESSLIDKDILEKYNKNVAKMYVYLYFC